MLISPLLMLVGGLEVVCVGRGGGGFSPGGRGSHIKMSEIAEKHPKRFENLI